MTLHEKSKRKSKLEIERLKSNTEEEEEGEEVALNDVEKGVEECILVMEERERSKR